MKTNELQQLAYLLDKFRDTYCHGTNTERNYEETLKSAERLARNRESRNTKRTSDRTVDETGKGEQPTEI